MAATTTTVAAVAIAGVTMLPNKPTVELLNFAVGENYVEYEISIEEMQDDLQYYLVISTSNETDRTILVEEDGIYQNKAEDLKSEWEYTLAFISYDDTWGITTYFEKNFQTVTTTDELPDDEDTSSSEEPPAPDDNEPIPDYQVGINEVTVIGLNKIRIDFWCQNLDENASLGLRLNGDNQNTNSPIILTPKDLERGYVTAVVDENSTLLSIQPIVRYGIDEEVIEFSPYEYTLPTALEADIKVNPIRGTVVFYLKGITKGATQVSVTDTATATELTKQVLYEDYVEVYYEGESQFEYAVSLLNDADEKTTDDFHVIVNTAIQEVGEYIFNYKNANNVGITYNEDGTINVYIQTDFETEDERLYYQIQLGTMRFQSRDPLFTATDLPNEPYGLTYEVCYEENGVQYCVESFTVSGQVNEFYFDGLVDAELTETTAIVTITEFQTEYIDISNIVVVTSSGEEIQLSADDFVYNENEYTYTATCAFENDFEFIAIYLTCTPFADNMQDIEEYVGSLSIRGSCVIYKDINEEV
ncbi:MAG: hypothetical protein E7371_03770 [Clostridiales bacterium]|nr:hypothetical protein [Clostridiales bacterium]